MEHLDAIIEDICTVSTVAETYITNHEYLLRYDEDEVSPKLLANDCLAILNGELQDAGIRWTCDIEELLESFYFAKYVVRLGVFVHPAHVVDYVKRRPSMKNTLLESDDKLHTLANNYCQDPQVTDDEFRLAWEYLTDRVTTNLDFNQYIENILHTIPLSVPTIENFEETYDFLCKAKQSLEDLNVSIEKTYTPQLGMKYEVNTEMLTTIFKLIVKAMTQNDAINYSVYLQRNLLATDLATSSIVQQIKDDLLSLLEHRMEIANLSTYTRAACLYVLHLFIGTSTADHTEALTHVRRKFPDLKIDRFYEDFLSNLNLVPIHEGTDDE